MGEVFEGEFVAARYVEDRPGHLGHLRYRERVVRCADCRYARRLATRGLVCAVHGGAGWFATEADGYCWKGERR